MDMSKLFSVNVVDFLKAFLLAVAGAFLGALYTPIKAWIDSLSTNAPMVLDWLMVFTNAWHVAVGAAVTYIFQKFFTASNGATYGIKATIVNPVEPEKK